MALVLPRTRQLPTQQLQGYTNVLNRVMTSTKAEQEAGYQSVVKKEDASIDNIKPVGVSLSRTNDPEAPNAGGMKVGISTKLESIGNGFSLSMKDTQKDFFKRLDGDMYKYRLVPNGEMVDAWHENKGDRFGRDKNTTQRIFNDRQTNQFGELKGEDRYMEEDTYEPVKARPAMGLPVTEERPSLATRDGRSRAVALSNAGLDDERFSRFLDEIVGVPMAATARAKKKVVQEVETATNVPNVAGTTSRLRFKKMKTELNRQIAHDQLKAIANRQIAKEKAEEKAARARGNLSRLARAATREQLHTDAVLQSQDDRRDRAKENLQGLAKRMTRRKQQSDALLESLDDELNRMSAPANTPVSTPSVPRKSPSEALASAARRLSSLEQTMEQKGLTPKKAPAASKTPTKTPKKVLFQTPETGGGGGRGSDTGGAADQTGGRSKPISEKARLHVKHIYWISDLNAIENAILTNTPNEQIKGLGPTTVKTLMSGDSSIRQAILKQIDDRRRELRDVSESGGAAPNKEALIDKILEKGLKHHSTGQAYTREGLRRTTVRYLQSILSKK